MGGFVGPYQPDGVENITAKRLCRLSNGYFVYLFVCTAFHACHDVYGHRDGMAATIPLVSRRGQETQNADPLVHCSWIIRWFPCHFRFGRMDQVRTQISLSGS